MACSSIQHQESKPDFSFTENNDEVTFILVLDGLKVERKISNVLKKQPRNAIVLNQIINEQSINFAIEMNSPKKIYRFKINRLPSQISPEKTKLKYEKDKVIINLYKSENDSWKQFVDSDFETEHLVAPKK